MSNAPEPTTAAPPPLLPGEKISSVGTNATPEEALAEAASSIGGMGAPIVLWDSAEIVHRRLKGGQEQGTVAGSLHRLVIAVPDSFDVARYDQEVNSAAIRGHHPPSDSAIDPVLIQFLKGAYSKRFDDAKLDPRYGDGLLAASAIYSQAPEKSDLGLT